MKVLSRAVVGPGKTYMSDPYAKCFENTQIAGLKLRNRFLKAATFEGRTPGGVPGVELTCFHRRIGQGGVAMTNLFTSRGRSARVASTVSSRGSMIA